MRFRVRLEPTARKALGELPASVQGRILGRLMSLEDDPRPPGAEPLHGKLKGLYKLRVGEYRVAYQVDDAARAVAVWEVGHRSRAYQHVRRRRR